MTASESPRDFFETSALVKRYHVEPGTDVVRAAFERIEPVRLTTDIALIELHSAFARRVRMGEITAADFQQAKARITEDTREGGVLHVEEVGAVDKAEATRLIEQYGLSQSLRTLDALHLAVIKRLGPERLRAVYCADRPLIAVLRAEGFTVINPEASSQPQP